MNEYIPLQMKMLKGCLITTLLLVFLTFCIVWISIPLSFMWSLAFQTFMVFIPIESPKNPNFHEPQAHGINYTCNFYVTVNDSASRQFTEIGIWMIQPKNWSVPCSFSEINESISSNSVDVLIYLHGVYANRAKPISQYNVFREHFLVLGIDHRGYGDSGENVDMTEIGIIEDHVQIYEWLRRLNSHVDVYYWGHSLGSGLVTHTLRRLKDEKQLTPNGLILESPFTSIEDVIRNIIFNDIFGWLAYFDATMIEPLHENGLQFISYQHIRSIDCPIMILHAEDDAVIPYKLGEKLYEIAKSHRTTNQGEIIFHGYSADLGYNHNDITSCPNISITIKEFIETCRQFNNK